MSISRDALKIGGLTVSPPVFLAPMAGVTNLPFRRIARRYGCPAACTEMISANGLSRGMHRSLEYLQTSADDRPLGVQIFGADPFLLAAAARIVSEAGADFLDINMGCPVRKVVKTGAGAAFMKDLPRVAAVIRAVREATHLPLTVKMRSGWRRGAINAVAVARIAEEEGVDAVIVHPRTADQGYAGCADWAVIAAVKSAVAIPVIGNGDLREFADVLDMRRETNCDGWMIGRAALGNPWIFREILLGLAGGEPRRPSPAERGEVVCSHLAMEMALCGQRPGVHRFRKHLLWYTKGLAGGAAFRERVHRLEDPGELIREVCGFFAHVGQASPDEGGGEKRP